MRRGYPLSAMQISSPITPEALLDRLADRGYAVTVHHHAPVFTVAEAQAHRGAIAGAHVKNLFVKDRKGALFLIVCGEERRIDLKTLHLAIGASGKVSFASAETLRETLGVEPGSVTPLGVVNAPPGALGVIVDAKLAAQPLVNVHPLVNTMTVGVATADLLAFMAALGHPARILSLPEAAAA
jgi:Ala-tRNA(Pro) deacylase